MMTSFVLISPPAETVVAHDNNTSIGAMTRHRMPIRHFPSFQVPAQLVNLLDLNSDLKYRLHGAAPSVCRLLVYYDAIHYS